MQTTQRIAKDVKFLQTKKSSNMDASDIRMRIIRATKFLVGDDVLNTTKDYRFGNGKETEKTLMKYKEFSRLPFPSIFLEPASGGGVLVEEVENEGFRITSIDQHGVVVPFEIYVDLTRIEPDVAFPFDIRFPGTVDVRLLGLVEHISGGLVVCVCEFLIFLNVSNVTIHSYKPTKKENAVVPKPLLPFYEYKVLDIYREKDKYNSLKEITDDLALSAYKGSIRRAHTVRGHFKKKKNGLFWWSPFTRCRKNVTTAGIIDKDYRVN